MGKLEKLIIIENRPLANSGAEMNPFKMLCCVGKESGLDRNKTLLRCPVPRQSDVDRMHKGEVHFDKISLSPVSALLLLEVTERSQERNM